MDKLEPVAWMVKQPDRIPYFYEEKKAASVFTGALYKDLTPLYALPSTHRIVSVELLEACMRECYMPEDDLRDRIGAIIDNEEK